MKTTISLIFCFIAFISALEARHTYGSLTVLSLDRVHDGDTFIVDIADVHPIIGKEISIRINGIDTPEINDPRPKVKALACKARDYAEQKLKNARLIELKNLQRDKYFRLLADVYIDGVNLGEDLIKAGLAKPYDGKAKPKW